MAPNLQLLFDNVPHARKALVIPALALRSVTSRGGKSVYASSDTLFKGAVFGRDSLEVAEDLLRIKPKLARNVLINLAELQGLEHNKENEEEFGKIIHEYRTTIINGKPIDKASRRIFNELSGKWGGSGHKMAYYGSVDSTPHFLRTLKAYCDLYGNNLLDAQVTQRNGVQVTMQKVAVAATDWLVSKLSSSESGLIEYQRTNPHGILNQVWKDSEEFYVHENKEMANHAKPIASIEVQALGYDAFMAAAAFFPEHKTKYQKLAQLLRDRTIELLWQDDKQYFALGTDYDKKNKLRIIRTETANPAFLLDTGFFDEIASESRQKFVTAIVKKVMSKDFLTAAGIRSRSLGAANLVNIWDYHGSYVSWPKETYDIAKGLRRQGLPKLAHQLENRLLNIILKTYEYPEFVYVDEWGRVLTGKPKWRSHGELIFVEGTNTPERLQAWTVSAVMAIISARLNKKFSKRQAVDQDQWQKELEARILSRIPKVNRYINPIQLLMRYPTHKYKLAKGKN